MFIKQVLNIYPGNVEINDDLIKRSEKLANELAETLVKVLTDYKGKRVEKIHFLKSIG